MGDSRLSIITINRNNAAGLEKTLLSINAQTCKDFEHIIIDGASDDGSVEIIKKYDDGSVERRWISEPDTGIYNAMNNGIRMAKGEYLQFVNSGDCLVDCDVTGKMLQKLRQSSYPPVLYGNMQKQFPDGKIICNRNLPPHTFYTFYVGTINHSSSYIEKKMFDKYGLYDESFKIVSDWKWFLQVVGVHGEKAVYVNVDVTLFDMCGISETNKLLNAEERRKVLESELPPQILADYDKYGVAMSQTDRLRKYPFFYKIVWFIERCLFKYEKLFPKNIVKRR